MKKASIIAQLENNKTETSTLETYLMGELSQEDSAELLAELKALMDERYIYLQTLAAFTQGNAQERSVRFFSPEPVDLESPENLAHQCALIAETMRQDLTFRLENHEISQDMHDHAQAAIKYELEHLNATTIEQFELQCSTAVEQAVTPSSHQASCS
tara:strand:+ start:18724 stop:19194 length:471 start_codon:yes stop_codon:yes gene_type:complete